MSFPLTDFQMECLGTIRALVADKPWLPASYVMAHVRIESGWDPTIEAGDYAATGSVGLMQVTAATARQFGYDPAEQTDPVKSLAAGIAYIDWARTYLMKAWGFKETILYHPVCISYNQGVGNTVRGNQDPRYFLKWGAAQQGYAFVDMAAKC